MTTPSICNIAGYFFGDLGDLPALKQELLSSCQELGIRGTILISPEGINLFLAGSQQDIETFRENYKASPWLPHMILHVSYSQEIPFTRLLVKIKKEIIAFGPATIDPSQKRAPSMMPKELRALYEKGEPFLLLDTRNDYEVRVGTFQDARHLDVSSFRAFRDRVQELLPDHKDTLIVTVCTGGVRCEKAALFMAEEGFTNVYQLHGGFLGYFKECGDAFYKGDCFVFDKRVAVTPQLGETHMRQCYACRNPLSPEDMASPLYQEGVSCPYCTD